MTAEPSIEELEAMLAQRKAEAKAAQAAAKLAARQAAYAKNNAGRIEYLEKMIERYSAELQEKRRKAGLDEEDTHE